MLNGENCNVEFKQLWISKNNTSLQHFAVLAKYCYWYKVCSKTRGAQSDSSPSSSSGLISNHLLHLSSLSDILSHLLPLRLLFLLNLLHHALTILLLPFTYLPLKLPSNQQSFSLSFPNSLLIPSISFLKLCSLAQSSLGSSPLISTSIY